MIWRLSHISRGDKVVLWKPGEPARRVTLVLHECGVVMAVDERGNRVGSAVPQHQLDEAYYGFIAKCALINGAKFQGECRNIEIDL